MTARRNSPLSRLRLETLEERCVPADFSGSISGRAFVDRNLNRARDVGEAFISGAQVRLIGTASNGDDVNLSVRATDTGRYSFTNVMPGRYRVSSGPATGRLLRPGRSVVLGEGQSLVNRNVAFGALASRVVSLRQLRNNPAPEDVPTGGEASEDGTATVNTRENNRPVVKGTIATQSLVKNGGDTFLDLAAFFDDQDMTNSQVRFKTRKGDINVELFDRLAPQTVANFLNYVTSDTYDNTVFHRLAFNSSTPFVLQGGGFEYNEDARTITTIEQGPQVNNEFSTSNTQGTIAMAKLGADVPGGGPNSATNQFFFNLSNNASNLDSQNGGFTVFGKIVGTADQTTLTALQGLSRTDQSAFNGAFDNFPLENYSGTAFPTDVAESNLAMITDVEVIRRDELLTYEVVTNSNEALATLEFVDNQLKMTPAAGQTGTAEVTVRATDRFGASVERTFTIEIANSAPNAVLTLDPTNVTTSDTLTANVTATDPNGDEVSVNYAWTVDGLEVRNVTKTGTGTDQLDLSTVADVGPDAVIEVAVTPTDSNGLAGSTVRASRTVGNRAPTVSVNLNTQNPFTADVLTATAAPVDLDGDSVTLTYSWSVNGTVVKTTTATAATTDTLDLGVAGNGNTGDTITVTVTPNDGRGDGTAASATAQVVNSVPTFTASLNDTAPRTNDVLTVSGTATDADGDAVTFDYVWRVNGSIVRTEAGTSAVADSLDLSVAGNGTRGDTVTVTVTPRDAIAAGTPQTFTATVANSAPSAVVSVNTTTPAAIDTVTATVVATDPDADPVSLTYVWTVGGTVVRTETKPGTTDALDLSALATPPASGTPVVVRVTPSDGSLTGTEASAAAIVA